MPFKIELIKVQIWKDFIDRRDWIKYLVMPTWHSKDFGNVIDVVPDATFTKFLEQHVQAYLEGKKPPAAIESAVMNIADDYASGREITVRAGDYIALQSHYRSPGKH